MTKCIQARMGALLVAALLAACSANNSDEAPVAEPLREMSADPALEAAIASSLDARPGLVGIAISVIDDDEVTGAVGGPADPEGRDLTTDTPFRIASVTKTFVAATVLRLMEQGEVELDTPIRDLIDDTYNEMLEGDGYDTGAITLGHLLMHTSGIDEHVGDEYFAEIMADPSRQWTREEQVALAMSSTEPLGAPGEQFSYSDTGYILVGHIIEQLTGEPLAAVVRRELKFDEIGLDHTWWEQAEEPPAGTLPRAHQYLSGEDVTGWNASMDLYGGGGVVSTTEDLATFMAALFRGGIFEDSGTLEIMTGAPGQTFPERYRIGLFPVTMGGVEVYEHGGFWGVMHLYAPDLDVAMAGVSLDQDGYRTVSNLMAGALSGRAAAKFAEDLGRASQCDQWALKGTIRTAADGDGFLTSEALVIDGETVAAVGSTALLETFDKNCVAEMPGDAVAMPGLHDGHAHLAGIGLRELTLNLEGTGSVRELKERIAAAAEGLDDGETLYGRGWIETGWPEGRMPTKDDLDEVVSDRPVLLYRADGHAAVVNSTALEAVGIDGETEDPDGGRIVRDEAGEATGLLIDGAMGLVAELLPQLDDGLRREALAVGARAMADLGWTSVHSMSVEPAEMPVLEEMAKDGELPIRVFNYLMPEALGQVVKEGAACTEDYFVCLSGVKFYEDGALGSRGALLFEDYSDEPGTRGLQLMTREDALAAYQTAYENGIQVATHAIGDRANFLVLDWYHETFGDEGNAEDLRWRIEHAQIVRPGDIPDFAQYGVIPSMQPSHAIGDLFFAPDRLGDERLDGAYAWQQFSEEGSRVVGGSDAPVEKGDPRIEIYAATERRGLDGTQEENWHAEEALSDGQALGIFTANAAYAVGLESRLGVLSHGYLADISIFSGDPFEGEWNNSTPLVTIVGGKPMLHTE